MSQAVARWSSRQHKVLDALGIDMWVSPDRFTDSPATDSAAGVRVDGATDQDWIGLEREALSCTRCSLHRSRTQVVFGVGNPAADWLIIGEAPGVEEDRRGEPFVGRAGQLLNEMLRSAGLTREQVYIANILKCRPPENRDPRPEEVSSCIPYLERQIGHIAPRLILAVGRIAAQNLLGVDTPVGKLRGTVHNFGTGGIPVVVTYHPAYLLRSPSQKRKVWEDLLLAQQLVQDIS